MTQPKMTRKPKVKAEGGGGEPSGAPKRVRKASAKAQEIAEGGQEGRRPESEAVDAQGADEAALGKLIGGLMDWYLVKINEDPMMEGFDILMNVEGPDGRMGHKYVMGTHEESMARLRADLETQYAGCHRYACAWRGWWERPDGQKFDGAILMLETRFLKPVIAGLPIGPEASGRKVVAGPLQILSAADWSLMHRGGARCYAGTL